MAVGLEVEVLCFLPFTLTIGGGVVPTWTSRVRHREWTKMGQGTAGGVNRIS